MNTAHVLGRPEWGQQDDQAAEEYAADLGDSQVREEEVAKHAASSIRQEWAAAAAHYWKAAYVAMQEKDFRAMRENARIASEADQKAGLDGMLLDAIFGGCETRPAERAVQLGRSLPAGQTSAARAAVRAEMARHAAEKAKAAAQEAAAKRADRLAKDKAAAAASAETAGKLAVGQEYTASLPYKLAKKADGLCFVEGVLVAVPGVNDGMTVRITALRAGRAYGLKYEAEGEIA